MRTVEGKKNSQKFNFKQNLFHKRKIALECKFQSNFVYSLTHPFEADAFLYDSYYEQLVSVLFYSSPAL